MLLENGGTEIMIKMLNLNAVRFNTVLVQNVALLKCMRELTRVDFFFLFKS